MSCDVVLASKRCFKSLFGLSTNRTTRRQFAALGIILDEHGHLSAMPKVCLPFGLIKRFPRHATIPFIVMALHALRNACMV